MKRFEKYRIFWQILFWWGAWLFISFSLINGFENPEWILLRGLPSLIGVILIVLLNVGYLLPQFFLQKKQMTYVLASVLLLTATVLLLYHQALPWSEWLSSHPLRPEEKKGKAFTSGARWIGRLTPLVIAFLGSTLAEIIRFANKKEKEAIQSDKEKLETELKFLKSQINPHFLFNALNNIYSLAVVQAPQTPESVMQLSEILRYMVYDSNEQKVALEREINYIKNFVDLKLLKDSRGMDVQLDLDQVTPGLMVAPLLFIPFVENAFKHSRIEDLHKGFIRINLKTDRDKITLRVVNSVSASDFTKDKIGGVGLENIQKRLKLLYPDDQHELTITQTDEQFEVVLLIFL